MNRTAIEWTDFSANPLKYRDSEGRVVWGCVHASDGCRHCYSEALAKRYARGGPFTAPTMAGLEPFLDETELRHMLTAKRIGGKDVAGSRCFVGDMTDLFGEWVPDELLHRLFGAMERRPDVTWQVLTKRSKRMRDYLSWRWGADDEAPRGRIPSRHIWLGVSAEDQRAIDLRVPDLLRTPAAVRFVSVEPLLGPVDLRSVPSPFTGRPINALDPMDALVPVGGPKLGWVIVGGESGPGARPCRWEWVRAIVDQCRAAGVAAFVKQGGASLRCEHSAKGGHIECFPEDLRIRQFPEPRA